MLALARALMSNLRLLLLDEPSLGLAPTMVVALFGDIAGDPPAGRRRPPGRAERGARTRVADHAYVMESGRIALEGPARDLLDNADVRRAYLGG